MRAILAALLAAVPMTAFGGDSFLPLFLVERSTNANVVHYDAKVSDGRLDSHQPVVAYWIMAAQNGRRQELNVLERTQAYGFSFKMDGSDESCNIRIVSDRQREIHVLLKDGAAFAETTIGGHRAYLQKIYVTTRKVLSVNVTVSAELYGTDVATGEERYEKVLH
jgi:Domain of unknown function (DUF4833)